MRCAVAALAIAGCTASLSAQRGAGAPAPAPPTPRQAAPVDLTGYWVAVVTEDWRWRMVTPPKGDVASVPLTAEGVKAANAWDPATDGSCLAYGAAGLMRMPTRLRVTWEDERVLTIESDAGLQTRRLVFVGGIAPSAPSLQGHSVAEWEIAGAGGRGGPPPGPHRGHLKVTTEMMSGGWLRRNGVPYSENARLTEYFDRFTVPNGDEWFVVTSIVSDPRYLTQDFVTSSHFRREADGAGWTPRPCT